MRAILVLALVACGDTIDHATPKDGALDDVVAIDGAPDAPRDAPLEPLPLGVIIPFDDVCPAGFTERIDLANQYLRGHDGDATYGETGGSASHTHQIAAHLHTLALAGTIHAHTLTFATTTSVVGVATGGSLSGAAPAHNHTITADNAGGPHAHAIASAPALTSGSAPNLPPFREVVLCEVTGAVTLVPTTARVLAETSCAAGWTPLDSIAGRLLRGHDVDGDLAEIGGGAHAHAFPHDHGTTTANGGDHVHLGNSVAAGGSTGGLLAGSSIVATSNHSHQITITNTHAHSLSAFTGSTAAATAMPEYREVQACRSPSPAPLPANALVIAMGPCPVGWQEVAGYRNRFLAGDDADGTPVEVGGGAHTHDAGHTHGSTGTTDHKGTYATSTTSATIAVAAGSAISVPSGGHSHPLTISDGDPHAHATEVSSPVVDAVDALPLFAEVVVCTRP